MCVANENPTLVFIENLKDWNWCLQAQCLLGVSMTNII